jgi:hypothetical protein
VFAAFHPEGFTSSAGWSWSIGLPLFTKYLLAQEAITRRSIREQREKLQAELHSERGEWIDHINLKIEMLQCGAMTFVNNKRLMPQWSRSYAHSSTVARGTCPRGGSQGGDSVAEAELSTSCRAAAVLVMRLASVLVMIVWWHRGRTKAVLYCMGSGVLHVLLYA